MKALPLFPQSNIWVRSKDGAYCTKSLCSHPGVLADRQRFCTVCHGYMYGLVCGEGKGWFEGGADCYTYNLCFQEKRKSFAPIMAYYEIGISPREKILLRNLISHRTKLVSAKRHKNNIGAAQPNMPTTPIMNSLSSTTSTSNTLMRPLSRKTFRW